MRTAFDRKADARTAVWDALEETGVARFPFPPHGRIANVEGAPRAARRLFETDLLGVAAAPTGRPPNRRGARR